MKKLLLSAFFICCTVLVFAQKVINDPNAEVRSVSGFHAIQVSNSFQVYITQGNEEALAVSSNHEGGYGKDHHQGREWSFENLAR
jgi:exosome complex RNA-binding protein Rrp42 (RNase PH superfamily)